MTIELQVFFTGLALFCFENGGAGPCAEDLAVLVDGRNDATICNRTMDGGHFPKLSFDARYMLPGSTFRYTLEPGPEGNQIVVAPLEGHELCFRREDPSTGLPLELPGQPPVKRLQEFRTERQVHPYWWKPDGNAFEWVPQLRLIHQDADRFCPQVEAPLVQNPLVISRVQLDRGELSVDGCSHYEADSIIKKMDMVLKGKYYVVWDLFPKPPEGMPTDFPKALPDRVIWKIPGIAEEDVILVGTCGRDGAFERTLFRLNSRGEDLNMNISNLPEKHSHSASDAIFGHMMWYYRLVDWPSNGDGCVDLNNSGCPDDLRLPVLPTSMDQFEAEVRGVISQTVKCSPGSG